jgi:hypothetical protein
MDGSDRLDELVGMELQDSEVLNSGPTAHWSFNPMTKRLLSAAVLLSFAVLGCNDPAPEKAKGAHDHDHDHDHSHHHAPPHGGTLVVLGYHFAHLEVLLEKETGKLTAYGLDGGAENPLPISMPALPISIQAADTSFTLTLAPVANALTGETAATTSEFSATHDSLVGVERFSATIPRLTIKGATLKSIQFRFPEGNEE